MMKNDLILKWLLFCCLEVYLFSNVVFAQTKHILEENDLVEFVTNQPAFSSKLTGSRQLLLVIISPKQQRSFHSTLRFYQKGRLGKWQRILTVIPVNLGKNGIAWDREQQAFFDKAAQVNHSVKKEGDNKTPLGIYPIVATFGFAQEPINRTFPYIHITQGTEAVDDIHSQFYNRIVEANVAHRGWSSSEKMWKIPGYQLGLIIGFNAQHQPGNGSNIFVHIWKNKNSPTAGCVAMSEEHLAQVLRHIDVHQHPFIAILPQDVLTKTIPD